MKSQILFLTFICSLLATSVIAQETQSDYEIQKEFKQQYAQFEDKLETVSSPDKAEKLITSIKDFDQKFEDHSKLLNKALHPKTYEQKMKALKRSSVVTKERLTTISQQTKKLDELQTQLASYKTDMNRLNKKNDSLQEAMAKSIKSEKKLSGMLKEYRRNLEKRDDLILAFIDSMVVAYQQMDLEALQDLENIDKKSRIKSNGDALEMIHDISAENLEVLEKNANKLRLQDYMRMAEVQQQFEMMWTRLGDKIQEVYDGENAEMLAKEVERNISQWNQKLKTQTFAALHDTLSDNEVTVDEFKNSTQFYNSLSSYLNKQIKQSKENGSKANFKKFEQFQEFWNRVEMQWSSNFVDSGIIGESDMATLNARVDTWARHAKPNSNNMLVYLLGASVLLAVTLGVMLIREKKTG
ncbi:hypothetical protein [Fodinibius halophilus]|uniref:Uncharacterized protein n=1 Tax=Fodinibius halophilus TaxID=1736908 RepID=A0A6M1T4R6_9BACT|nr:hypothetical protein [Fodinibius halophilus]NGP89059.1 hypothetical protein [Fodinibius halophilus]